MAELPQESLFARLLQHSQKENLDFLMVGGNAVNAYGYQRTTFDIDLAVSENQSAAWKDILLGMGYVLYFSTEAFHRFRGAVSNELLFPIDLMILSQSTFDGLKRDSIRKAVGNTNLPVPSPLHLIAMKLHALRQPERLADGKDLSDIKGLVKCSGIDVQSPGFLAILEKYGEPRIVRQLLQSFQGES